MIREIHLAEIEGDEVTHHNGNCDPDQVKDKRFVRQFHPEDGDRADYGDIEYMIQPRQHRQQRDNTKHNRSFSRDLFSGKEPHLGAVDQP